MAGVKGDLFLPDLQVLGSKGHLVTCHQQLMDTSSCAWPLMGSQLTFKRAKDWEQGNMCKSEDRSQQTLRGFLKGNYKAKHQRQYLAVGGCLISNPSWI